MCFIVSELNRPPYWAEYSPSRLIIHQVVNSKYFDLAIAGVIGLNVITMAMEYYMMPEVINSVRLIIPRAISSFIQHNRFNTSFLFLGAGVCIEDFQLLLYECFYHWGHTEDFGPWLHALYKGQVRSPCQFTFVIYSVMYTDIIHNSKSLLTHVMY